MKLTWILNEISGGYEVFFDMDGVLADIDAQCQKFFGKPSAMAYFSSYANQKEAWANIQSKGSAFWTSMIPLSDGMQVWNYVKKNGIPVSILSAPPKPKNVSSEYIKNVMKWKVQWCRQHLGNVRVLFAYSGEKGKFAKSNRILVDDFDKNLADWKSRGGIPVHFDNASSVTKQLKSIGVKL